MTDGSTSFSGAAGRRTVLWVALIGVWALVVVVAAAGFWVLRDGGTVGGGGEGNGGGGSSGDVEDTRQAPVEAQPSVAWSWRADEPILGISAADDFSVVSLDRGRGFVVLDHDGEELWRDDSEEWATVFVTNGQTIQASYSDDDGYYSVVFDTDGSRIWQGRNGENYWRTLDDGGLLVRGDQYLAKVDHESGERVWRVDAGRYTMADDAVVVLDGDEVRRHDVATGEPEWITELPDGHDEGLGEDYHARMGSSDDFILVSTGVLTALDLDGDVLWSEDVAGEVTGMLGGRLVVFPRYGERTPAPPYPIYDATGQVGELDVGNDYDSDRSTPRLVRVVVDGEELNFDPETGVLHDIDGTVVERGYDDAASVVRGGVYTVAGDTLGYRRWGETDVAWSLTLYDIDPITDAFSPAGAPEVWVRPLEGALLVTDRSTVRRFE